MASAQEAEVGLVHDGLSAAALTEPHKVAVRAGESSWTFEELQRWSRGFAAALQAAGVEPADRVAVMLTNRVELIVAVHAISQCGAAAVMLNPAWKAAEVAHAVAITRPAHGLADGAAVELLAVHVPVTDIDQLVVDRDANPVHVDIDHDDEAVLVFSSGTTGMPKAVRHTHRTMSHAVWHWRWTLDLTPADRLQIATPPSHILGLLNLLTAAAVGVTVRLHPRFDLDEVLASIEGDRITIEMAVAPIALAMANHPDLERFDLSSLRYIIWGATPVTPSVAELVTNRTGARFVAGYGASEVPVIAVNPVREPDRWRLDSAGLPTPGVDLRVVDLDTGAVLSPGSVGEIQARSASAMVGYLPTEATADAIVDGGWYRTGDVGWLEDDGWVHLTDRAKEMIKVKAFQVAPAEVEAVLHGHPEVLDCAVFGVPDELAGEVPIAAVKLAPGATVTAEELRALVAESLATYKHVRQVLVVDEIPRLPSGKALRRVLRDQWKAG